MAITSDFKSTWSAAGANDLPVLAGGVAYFAFLSLVPLLTAGVLAYGLIADPQTVGMHIESIAAVLPETAAALIGDQLRNLVSTSDSSKGLALVAALALALISARGSATALVRAISITFGDPERRGFVRANLMAIALVVGALLGGGLLIAGGAALTALADSWGLSSAAQALSYLALALAAALGSAVVIRRAPPALDPAWGAAFAGGLVAAIGMGAATFGFGYYVANFGSYNATYGSMGAVIVLLTWMYICAYMLLLGAQFAAVRSAAAKI